MNVLLVHPTPRPFIALDVGLLRTAFDVRSMHVRFTPRRQFAVDTCTALLSVCRADVVLAWFGGLHALLPFLLARLLGKRCAVIASGVDVAAVPEIGYGHMRGGVIRQAGRLVFRLAHRVFAVSQHTAREAQRNAQVPAEKMRVILHGVPDLAPRDSATDTPCAGVITVAAVNEQTVQRKGLEAFLQAAARLPEVSFALIGGGDEQVLAALHRTAPDNVSFAGWLDQAALFRRMRRAKVYVQVSAYESFGMALAEAMQCGCRPVVTARGALPEVVGPAGWYVPYGDPEATAAAIRKALEAPPAASERARQHIRRYFPIEERRRRLVEALRTL